MCEVMEGIVVSLIAIVDVSEEILEVFFVDVFTMIVFQSSAYLESQRFKELLFKF